MPKELLEVAASESAWHSARASAPPLSLLSTATHTSHTAHEHAHQFFGIHAHAAARHAIHGEIHPTRHATHAAHATPTTINVFGAGAHIVLFALFWVTEHFVRLLNLLEHASRLRFFFVSCGGRLSIRMILERQLAVGLFDVAITRVLLHAQHFVVVAFACLLLHLLGVL